MGKDGYLLLGYHNVEAAFALRLATDLKNAGVNVWLDRLDLHLGDDWTAMLSSALSHCAAFMPIMSPDYIASDYGRTEMSQISQDGRAIIPVLLRYIPPAEWPVDVSFDNVIDFTEWQDAEIYQQRIEQVVDVINHLPVVKVSPPVHPQKRYVAQLAAYIELYKSVLEYVPLAYPVVDHTRDNWPHTINKTPYRPAPAIESTWDLTGPFILRYAPLADTRYIDSLQDALRQYPLLVLVGDYGSGKTSAMHALMMDMVQEYIGDMTSHPMPLLLELSEWQPEESLDAFIQRHWPWRADIWEEIRTGQVVVFCDGLDEMGGATAKHLEQLRAWLNGENAPKTCLFACRDSAYSDALNLNLPVISIEDMTPTYTEQFINRSLGDDAGDELLDALTSDALMTQRWHWALHNKLMLRALMYVYQHSPEGELPTTPALMMEQVMTFHWQREQILQNPDWVPQEEMVEALTRLAYAVLEENRPHSVPYNYAVQHLGGKRMLNALRSANLLIVHGDFVRFFHPALMHLCASRRLLDDSWHPLLMQPQLDANGRRIAQAWDGVFMALAGYLVQADRLISAVADVDPFLAVHCMSVAYDVSPVVRRETLSRLMRLAVERGLSNSQALLEAMAQASPDLLEPILQMMRDGNWDERQLAMNVAIHLDIPTSADVAEALEVWNGSMDQTVANYLRQIGQEALPPLMRLLTADDPIRRRGAVWALGEMKDNAVVPTLIAALEDQDPMVRREAAVALRQFRDGAAVDSLIKLLRDESWHVRKVAAETLVDAGATAIPVLLRMMQDDRTDVRRIAIGVLGRLGNASAVPALLPYLEDDNSDIRAMAVTALGQIGDESAADGLGTLLNDSITPRWSDATIGQMAKNALEKIGTEKAMSIVNRLRLPSGQASTAQQAKEKLINITRPKPEAENKSTLPAKLQKMLRNSDWQLRRKAIVAIGRTGKRGALPVLLEGLQDSEAEVRLAVMHLLPIYEGKTVLEHLSLALNDDDLTIAQMAAKQLTDIGSVSLPILTNAVLSADTDVRALAVQSLGYIAHESAAPILIEALTDHAVPSWSDQTVGKLASEALMQLNTPEAIAADTPDTVEELEPSRFSPASPEDTLMPMDDVVTASSITAASATSGGPEARQQEQQEQLIKLRDLIDRLQSGEWRKQHKAAKELNKMAKDMRGRRNKVIADKIAMLLSSPDDFVRLSAAEAVAWIADEGAIPLLVPMLKEKSYTIQIAAMRALAEIGERRVVSHITPLLAPNQNQLVREVAAEVLGYLRDKAALPALLEALNDHEGFVRRSVIHALGDIGNLQAVPRLLDFLSDQDAQVRWVTVEALGKIGAPEAVKDLKRLLVDSYEVPYADEFGQTSERRLSEMVVRALENIGTQDAKQAIVDWQASQV